MAEYIEKQAAIDALGEEPENWIDAEYDLGTADQWRWDMRAIKAIPPADVRPVVRGHWERTEGDSRFMCSVCKGKEYAPTIMGQPTVWDYCPNCGAWMKDGDAE